MTSAGRPFLPRLPTKGPLLRPTLERLGRFSFRLPSVITVHLDAGYDSAKTRGLLDRLSCEAEVATKGNEPQSRGGTP